ncbi:M48 family metalloprotease [bacterium SCSIO 12643]|nr:M48 family metalloprotease [bacterium SCSIO 12643]
MMQQDIKLSSQFKTQTTKSVISILLFVITYIAILLFAIGLTIGSFYVGLILILKIPNLFTVFIGIGFASLGILILVFILKFVFKSHKIDLSHLIEINRKDEPELFEMIEDIVKTVDTDFPKKIYLSPDVNAGVFYDSSFFSMFLPIRKNLQIGLGLINTVTKNELKAILAHEFGHFSQRSMKVGSYVYNVNQVIFNMLYDNESFDRVIQKWGNVNGIISIFVLLAIKIIEGIQWVLIQLYNIINKSYMGLSREMEFHADEIATRVTGYEPLKNALLRMNLAEYSFNSVLSFYEKKISNNQNSPNIYPEQSYIMNFIARDDELKFINELPSVTIDELNKFNKSKLVIKDQWASHPSTEDRVNKIEALGIESTSSDQALANNLINRLNDYQKELTKKVFSQIEYKGQVSQLLFTNFKDEYDTLFNQNSFSKIYNGYYDMKNPLPFDPITISGNTESKSLNQLFSEQNINMVFSYVYLKSDLDIIKQISDKTIRIKSFDYDGIKYSKKESSKLYNRLNTELLDLEEKIKQNDINVFSHFKKIEHDKLLTNKLASLYKNFFEFDVRYDSNYKIYEELSNQLQFVQFSLPIEEIEKQFRNIKSQEQKLKIEIQAILNNPLYREELTPEIKENFETYLSKDWLYFGHSVYNDKNLEMLFSALNDYAFLLSRGYFIMKKQILDYQIDLISK